MNNLSAVIELTNAKFVDVINGCFFDQGTSVLIKNGKIAAMPNLEHGKSEIKPDFSIDLQGKTVLPGLFNVHCHIQMVNPTLFAGFKTIMDKKKYHDSQVKKNMADCLARGITNIRDAYSDNLQPNKQLQQQIQNKELYGPRILQAVVVGPLGGYLTPELKGVKKYLLQMLGFGAVEYENLNSGVIAFSPDAREQQVRDAVNRAIDERGADLIKVGESLEKSLINANPVTMPVKQLQAITDQARCRGVQSTIHSVSKDTFRRAVAVGFSSLAHMARDSSLTREDAEACLTSNTIIEPTLSVGYDMSWEIEESPFYGNPNLKKLYEFRKKTFSDIAEHFWIPELKDHVIAGFKKADRSNYNMLGILNLSKSLTHYTSLPHYGIKNTELLIDHGVKIACGNDGGIQACTPAMIAHELSIFDLFMNNDRENKKFDNIKAVQAATINSAESMGIDGEFGSIQAGKVADLAILNGNPFEDSSIIGRCVDALFMDGRLIINNCGLETKNESKI